jgi:UDP-N-acetylmuramyl pentapeptide phosphotransferase/UDP-N-acetylglucosamine-1-phosphate transferase
MRKFKMGLITLAASAAVLIPAAGASASTQSVASTEAVSTALTGCQFLCFNTYIDDVVQGNDVDIDTASTFCGINLSVIGVLLNQEVDCGDDGHGHHKKVKRTK